MAAFLEPSDGRKTPRAIFRLRTKKNFVKARKNFPGNRLELCGIQMAKHSNPRIPESGQ
jgi:hypothetical protein